MIKEFCVDYAPSKNSDGSIEYIIKVRTGEEFISNKVSEHDSYIYIQALMNLGYKEMYIGSHYQSMMKRYTYLLSRTEEQIEELKNKAEQYKHSLKYLEKQIESTKPLECTWWNNC